MDSSFSLANAVAAAITFFTLLGTIFFLFLNRKFRSHQENKTMASSSPPPSSDLTQSQKYHVFPSFHGPDVRRTLLSNILAKLRSKGIDAFVDNDIERSKPIGPALMEAIRGSRIAIVFLSKNYASSTWCLDELVEIIKCRDELGQIVISLFHGVDPSDVRKQIGDFGKVFRETCKKKQEDDTGRWRHALAEVANIAGYDSKNWCSEAEMIEKIATEVSTKLNMSTPSSDFDDLVGMESHMIKMEQDLRLDLDDVRIIGILGPPGIGKTTIARFLFNRHYQDFQLTLFMDNIKRKYKISAASSDDYGEKLSLHKEFMSQLTNEKDIKITHLGIAKDRLNDKKVLVVLDDVDQLVQLEAMVDKTWFGPCSRIIVTTQDGKILEQSGINLIYKVDLPSHDEALQMFCMSAFRQKYPNYSFTELACEVTRLAGALPLGLTVMGSYFRGLSEQGWAKALQRLRTHLDGKIESILMFSYDSLSVYDQSLFNHIACIFNDKSVEVVEACLATSSVFSDVAQGLCVLVEKSLIEICTYSGRISMHNLLVQLGREIVLKQSLRDPGKREFLFDATDIDEVLNDDQAGSSVIGIDLKEDITCTSERAFERLSNLQFLIIGCHGININPRSMNYISRKLRLLSWTYFGMPRFPSSFHTKFLVLLNMPDSNLEKLWEETQPLSNLKWVNLRDSTRLKELPDLSTATNLCELNLSDCSKLVELHSSIGNAINLKRLQLYRCLTLVEIPSSIDNLINLESLNLYGCSNLVEISCSMENATKLYYLDFDYCRSLVKLPSFIGSEYNKFVRLSFRWCSSLVKLPSYIGNPVDLKELDLTGCSSLVELPSFIGNAINLEYFDLSGCSSLVELPSSMKNLLKLDHIELKKCSKLEVVLTNINLENLEKLNLSGCSLLKSDPEASTHIDPWIGRISSLRKLVLSGMNKMVTLPQLPDSIVLLVADHCESLERLDCSFQNPDIARLNFGNCFKLNQEARDLIIQTRTNQYALLPGEEVPVCFTYQSSRGSLTVSLNEKPFLTPTIFKACITLADEHDNHPPDYAEYESDESESDDDESESDKVFVYNLEICCSITSKENPRTACISEKIRLASCLSKHLYIFEVEAVEVTSTELVFEFVISWDGDISREIKECGVYQIRPKDGGGENLLTLQKLSWHAEASDLAASN